MSHTRRSRMPLGSLPRAGALRAAGVLIITATITLAAACSDEDTVNTVPPPRPGRTTTADGPQGVPRPTTPTDLTASITHSTHPTHPTRTSTNGTTATTP